MEVFLFDRTTEALELADDVSLRLVNPVGPGGVRTDGNELLNMLVGSRSVKPRLWFPRQGRLENWKPGETQLTIARIRWMTTDVRTLPCKPMLKMSR